MKKLLILILLVLTSCQESLITGQSLKALYVVKKIDITTLNDPGYCTYYLSTKTSFMYYVDDVIIEDSVGKFAINDTLIFKVYKK